MSWLNHLYFYLLYLGRPPWDTQISPPELMEFIENHPPGRALDLGCGTGTNVITLASNGWKAVGVDFVKRAVRIAKLKAEQAGVAADFFQDDVTRLDHVEGVFDLVLDIGCYHSLDTDGKRAYVTNLEPLIRPGSTLLMYGFLQNISSGGPGINETDLADIQKYFDLEDRVEGTDRGERRSVWLTFLRSMVKNKI